MSKNLIIYFSRKDENYMKGSLQYLEVGNTEVMAKIIKDTVGADLFKVEREKEYSKNYYECIDEAKVELKNNERPAIKERLDNIDEYENIFIGYPLWWGTLPMPLFTQLEGLNYEGKRIIPFVTHEGSGFASSISDIEKICGKGKVVKGLAIVGSNVNESKDKISEWAKEVIK